MKNSNGNRRALLLMIAVLGYFVACAGPSQPG